MQPQACVVPSARFRFGHTGLGTFLGTLSAFFNRSGEKSERKRAGATVFLTVAFFDQSGRHTRCFMQPSGEVAERSLTNVVAVVCGEDR